MFKIPFAPNSRSLWGVWGAAIVLVSAAVVIPQYTSYESRFHTSEALSKATPIREMIENNAIKQKNVFLIGRGLKLPNMEMQVKSKAVKGHIEVTDNGMVLVKDGLDGQLIVLIPSLAADKVTWRCLGGSAAGVPANCRFGVASIFGKQAAVWFRSVFPAN